MSKNATQRREHKRITAILICCLAPWANGSFWVLRFNSYNAIGYLAG